MHAVMIIPPNPNPWLLVIAIISSVTITKGIKRMLDA